MFVGNEKDVISKEVKEKEDRRRRIAEIALLSTIIISVIGYEATKEMKQIPRRE